MNRDNMITWLRELNSGTRNQGRGRLGCKGSLGNEYCCLGVAAEISGLGGWNVFNDYLTLPDNEGGEVSFMTTELVEWLGLTGDPRIVRGSADYADDVYDIKITKTALTVSKHNDNGMPFPEIADLLAEEFGITAGELLS